MGSIDRYELQTGHRGTPFFLLILTAGKSSGWGGAGEVRVGVVEGGGGGEGWACHQFLLQTPGWQRQALV